MKTKDFWLWEKIDTIFVVANFLIQARQKADRLDRSEMKKFLHTFDIRMEALGFPLLESID